MNRIVTLFSLHSFKGFAFKILSSVLLYYAEIWMILIAVIAVVLFDTVTGIKKALKKGEKITSRRMRDTIEKMLIYNLLILVLKVVEGELLPWIPLVKFGAGVIGITEIYSIFENIDEIRGTNFLKTLKNLLKRPAELGDIINSSKEEDDNKKEIQ